MMPTGWRNAAAAAVVAAMSAVAPGQDLPRLARPQTTPVHVRAILVDGQLNQKPVPRLELRFAPSAGGAAATLRTDFDGQADLELIPGQYTLTTPSSIGFDGQAYTWRIRFTLKAAPLTVTLSNDNALSPATAALPGQPASVPPALNLAAQFQHLRSTVVAVWSDLGHGSGFIVALHPGGMAMLLTSDHIVAGAHDLAVQMDAAHKVAATVLSEDPGHDTAALAANLSNIPGVAAATLASASTLAAVPAGAPVFTIGSPLGPEQILTSGIVGSNNARAFIANIALTPGNAGGPLFTAQGAVIGIASAASSGVAAVIPITAADTVLRRAETRFESMPPLPDALLPVVPSPPYPAAALQQAARRSKFDPKLYQFSFAGYDVTVATPPLYHWEKTHRPNALGQPENDPARDRMSSLGADAPVVWIEVSPKLKSTVSSLFLHSLTADYTHGRSSREVRRRFQGDFGRMELNCGGELLAPIAPGRIPAIVANKGAKQQNTAFEGLYAYPPDAFRPACGPVSLTVYANGKNASPQSHPLSPALVNRVWDDFAPWRAAAPAAAAGNN